MSFAIDKRVSNILVFLIVAAAIWLPRGLKLNQFVTVDESKWLVRSANFYEALANDHYEDTFQHGHPGVTIMWSGMMGYLWKFPEYTQVTPGQFSWSDDQFDEFLVEQGYHSLDMLATGRTIVVWIITLALTASFFYTRRLLGWIPAVLAFGLIAFAPFQVALSRVLHPDSLLSPLMLLSSLAFLNFLYRGRNWRDLIVSAIVGALTILTKTPGLFLIPLVGLFALVEVVHHTIKQRTGLMQALRRIVGPLVVWAAVLIAVYVLLWPALWVAPRATLAEVLDISGDYAEQGHSSPVFYNGEIINGDPGTWFYPVNYLWRTTPLVLLGLLFCIGFFALRRLLNHTLKENVFTRLSVQQTALGMFFFAIFFVIFMNLGAKKFDRYSLPIFMPLDILAGLGWAGVVLWLMGSPRRILARYAAPGLAIGIIALQASFSLPAFPYYMSYYNPVMGGANKAGEVMLLGWGEGLDQAARYLNETVDVDTAVVASWYPRGPFSYFYDGRTDSNRSFWEADYSVIYAHQWRRELPSRRMMSYFNSLTPEESVWIDGIEFVRVYAMLDQPYSDFTVEWEDAIRLVYYDTFSGSMHPGQKYDMTVYFVKVGPIETNPNVLVRLVNQDGVEILRQEGWPDGMAFSQLEIGEIVRDNNYELEITEDMPPGLYRIEVAFYDPETLDHLAITSANTGEPMASPYLLDYLIIGEPADEPANRIDAPAILGDKVSLFGADRLIGDGEITSLEADPYAPGDVLDVRLYWRALAYMYTDYTAFVHLVGPDGQMAAQYDQRPLGGFLPTSYWPPNQVITDDYHLDLPADATPGSYQLHVGWYDLETGDRLPITRDGEAVGDSMIVATIEVQ